MSSNKCKVIDDITTGGGKLSVSEHTLTEGSFRVSLSEENPFEKRLMGYLKGRIPVQVGRLRFAVGEELISELLIRGADSLEAEYPGALGLQDLLIQETKSDTCLAHPPDPVKNQDQGRKETLESSIPAVEVAQKTESAADKTTPEKQGSSASSEYMNADEIPRLNLSGFDLGSNPVLSDQ